MTIHVSIKEAKDRFSELVRSTERGERVIITRHGEEVAELCPPQRTGGLDFAAARKWRQERGIERFFGEMSPDFDDPLPEDVLSTPER